MQSLWEIHDENKHKSDTYNGTLPGNILRISPEAMSPNPEKN
jgi:hypothetical protein